MSYIFNNEAVYNNVLIISFTVLLIVSRAYAQMNDNSANTWYFGKNAGLDFNSGVFPPASLNDSKMNTLEGCASIADNNGNLLLYSDGVNIWDKAHTKMPNANGTIYPAHWDKMLSGGYSSTQSVIITPVIGEFQRYYLFTTDGGSTSNNTGPKGEWDGLYYTVIDMSLNGGLGDIDTFFIHSLGYSGNKIPLADSIAEKVTAVRHANGLDYWIVAQKHFTSNFYAFKVSCQGIDHMPVITHVSNLGLNEGTVLKVGGCLTSSYDGRILAASYAWAYPIAKSSALWYCDFNNNIGIIKKIDTMIIPGFLYNVCFSPNDSILYVPAINYVRRYDRYKMNMIDSIFATVENMEIGPDGRIYTIANNVASLSVFHNPNDLVNPQYDFLSVVLQPGTLTQSGLPRYFNYKSKKKTSDLSFLICKGDSVNIGFDFEPDGSYEISWIPEAFLSDPQSPNPTAFPDTFMEYVLKIETPCDTLYDTIQVNVIDEFPLVDLGPDTTICVNDTVMIHSGEYTSYLWSTNETIPTIKIYDSGNYRVIVTNEYGCTDEDEINIFHAYCTEAVLFIPNVFSPNNDGVNDVLKYSQEDIKEITSFNIYNKWGKTVFEANQLNQYWDGTYKNESMSADVYTYKLTALDFKGELIYLTGNITLLNFD